MPKVKKNSSVIHPNSRKALQLARQVFHNEKLKKRKDETNLKRTQKLIKFIWFKDNVDTTKEIYSAKDMNEIIDKYLGRFGESEDKLKGKKSLNRHLSGSTFQEFKTDFLIQKEKQNFETCGLEVPDLMQEKSFDIFKSWNGDVDLLTAITTVVLTKKQLQNSVSKCKE